MGCVAVQAFPDKTTSKEINTEEETAFKYPWVLIKINAKFVRKNYLFQFEKFVLISYNIAGVFIKEILI